MKLYLIAGEVSGDLHASNLIQSLRNLNPEIQFRGVGGDRMKQQGLDMIYHIHQLNFMGLAEVLKNILAIRKALHVVKNDIASYKPDAVILIDYPGFNLQIARWVKTLGIRCIYYISPKIWAWRASRAKIIKHYVDLMLSILPFEQEFYAQYDFEINYVGNPIVDAIYHYPYNQEFIKAHSYSDKPIVALLPGSRKQEILQCLPVMLEASKTLADFRFIIAGLDYTKEWIAQTNYLNLEVVYNKTYDLLKCSKVAVVTSGTATLETALLNVPQVCCYKTSALTYFAAKKLIRVPYISLVNLINGKESIRELIQDNFTPSILRAEIIALADNEKYRSQILANYEILKTKIGGPGASDRAATAILNFI